MIFIIIIGKNTKKFRLKHDSKVSFCCIAIFIALATRHEIEYQRHSTRQQYAQNNNEQKKMSVGRISNSRSNRIIFFFFLFVVCWKILHRRNTRNINFGDWSMWEGRKCEHIGLAEYVHPACRNHRLSYIYTTSSVSNTHKKLYCKGNVMAANYDLMSQLTCCPYEMK